MKSSDRILVTVGDAAEMLGLSRRAIYDLTRDGVFTKRYVGTQSRNFRLEVAELQAYAANLPTEPSR